MDFSEFIASQMGDREDQKRQARYLRERTNAQLADAVKSSKRYEQLAAIAPMSLNPAFEKSVGVLAKQGEGEAPTVTGQQIYYGGEGRLEENPIHTEAKEAEREGRLQQMVGQQLAAGERANEANALRFTIAQMADATRREGQGLQWAIAQLAHSDRVGREAERRAEKAEKEGAKAEAADEKAVALLADRYTKTQLPSLMGAASRLNERIQGSLNKGESVPGTGLLREQATKIPFVSDIFVGEEGKINRSLISSVSNDLLKAYSGAAVTLSEDQRRQLEQMASGNYTERDFLNAWENTVVPKLNEMQGGVTAGFSPNVVKTYADRFPGEFKPGQTIIPAKRPEKKDSKAPTSGLTAAEEAELADLKKRFPGRTK